MFTACGEIQRIMRGRVPPPGALHEATLVHYDIRSANATGRTELHRFLSGRIVERDTKEGRKRYRYPGLLWTGGEWIGQSVILLEPDLADHLISKLQELRIRYSLRTVYVE